VSVSRSRSETGKWLVPIRRGAAPRLRLLCFSYGGGGASAFWPWRASLPGDVDLWALRLPGRESRLAEPFVTDPGEAVAAITAQLTDMSGPGWVFYGHSLGAGLALETAKLLRDRGEALPVLFLASGRLPPHCPYTRGWADRSEAELRAHLRELGGVEPEALDNPTFWSLYLPKIRADFRLNENLAYVRTDPFDFLIVLINGADDPLVNETQLQGWHEYTNGAIRTFRVGGGHFFIHSHFSDFIAIVAEQLAALSPGPAESPGQKRGGERCDSPC
jgi:surfactin synthase thioesterase subunit